MAVYTNGELEISIDGRRVPVSDLAEARRLWNLHRDSTGIGASEMHRHDGKVFQGKKLVARVSYNGRVWDSEDREISVSERQP